MNNIYCNRCKFFKEWECTHSENLGGFTYLHSPIRKRGPEDINKNTDCRWFRPRTWFGDIMASLYYG